MVCKEDVLSWFKDLESYKRIDLLCELLNMCLPFEVRFIGTYIEEMGRHTYQELRSATTNANDYEKLSKDSSLYEKGLTENGVRHRVLVNMSLLTSRNYSVANWLYRTVLRTEWIEDCLVKGNWNDENVQSEFLLLYVMALYHPAFGFDQKLFFGKILMQLMELKENKKNRTSPKTNVYRYPPGFGYPTVKSYLPEEIPVKSALTMPYGEETVHLHHQATTIVPPPTATQLPPDFVSWSRPGFPYGAPEVPPFPTVPNISSPLDSQATSPIHSRTNSPHRTTATLVAAARLSNAQLPPTALAVQTPQIPPPTPSAALPLEALTSPSALPVYNLEIKIPDEEIVDEDPQISWMNQMMYVNKVRPPNGLRYPCMNKLPPRALNDQMQSLSLDGELNVLGTPPSSATPTVAVPNNNSNSTTSLQHTSNSSSNNSPNQTPPDTPILLAHCPGRGGMPPPTNDKPPPAVNGLPYALSFNDATTSPPPPPPPSAFNNCTVPYTQFPATFAALPPTRSMFPPPAQTTTVTASYRAPFTAPPHHFHNYQPTNENSTTFPAYTLPQLFLPYSSQPQQFTAQLRPTAGCYNCGNMGHLGQDCTRQNIEDITQKKTYSLEYAAQLPDDK